jgi:hypothetical protein
MTPILSTSSPVRPWKPAICQPAGAVRVTQSEAVQLVTRLYDQFGYDTVDNSPLSDSWRSNPGQPAWAALLHQTRAELIANLAQARRIAPPRRGRALEPSRTSPPE